jgi:hypothetical protein
MAADDDVQSLGEVARGVVRVEQAIETMRAEFQRAVAEHVTVGVFEARMETARERLRAVEDRMTASEANLKAIEDERDRVRLALTVAILTALLAPIIVVLLLRGVVK